MRCLRGELIFDLFLDLTHPRILAAGLGQSAPLDQLEKRQQMSDLSSKPRVTPPNTHSPSRVCP
jgi:hypothetical protein